MLTKTNKHKGGAATPGDVALAEILEEIAVPMAVLEEARRRRDQVLAIAESHDAARDGAGFPSGSVAHGTTNRPLEDADCGVKVNRRYEAFRVFGPDAEEDQGPEAFIQLFSQYVLPELRRRYPRAEVDLEGNRAIKFLFNEPVEIDEWGAVDPYVELIVGLDRVDAPGIWIPNRRRREWDPADPELHTDLMTLRDPRPMRVLRAHILRLAKRAVKRDGANGGVAVMCSWNLSALALEFVTETGPLGPALLAFLRTASESISAGLTQDPAPAVVEPIGLPDGVTQEQASRRLAEMATVVEAALCAHSKEGARAHLEVLFGPEIEGILARERKRLGQGLRGGDSAALTAALGAARTLKPTRSGGSS
ncbi:MAG: hypothetical protein WB507_11360 [Solirubrobacterales bacterium]